MAKYAGSITSASVLCTSTLLLKIDIKSLTVILDKTQSIYKSNKYLDDGSFVVENKDFNTIYNFPNGFNEEGTFILICAGGGGSL